MTIDRTLAVKVLAARCDSEPGSVLTELLGRLQARSDELVRILRGESLRFELLVTGWPMGEVWIVFTPLGNVTAVTDRAQLGCDRRPHVLLRGEAEDILRLAVGLLPIDAAVGRGVFIPLVPVARFKRLLRVIGQDLLAMAA